MREVVVWVVVGEDCEYDTTNIWVVGVYATEAEAEQAEKDDEVRFIAEGGRTIDVPGGETFARADYTITSTILKIPEGAIK